MRETLAFVENVWEEMFPEAIYRMEFLDSYLAQNYVLETVALNAFRLFAGIAIFIRCLGVFGLSAFMTAQRTKEVGIRKLLGASVSSIVVLLSRDFLLLVLVAFIIASPLAGYAMSQWLQNFAYKTELSWWIFALAGGIAVIVALLTVSFQAMKAALSNPVNSLRSE